MILKLYACSDKSGHDDQRPIRVSLALGETEVKVEEKEVRTGKITSANNNLLDNLYSNSNTIITDK